MIINTIEDAQEIFYPDAIDWMGLACYYPLSEKFIIEFESKLEWHILLRCQNLSKEFLTQNLEKIKPVRYYLEFNSEIPREVKDDIYLMINLIS